MPTPRRQGENSRSRRSYVRLGLLRLLAPLATVSCVIAGPAVAPANAQAPVNELAPEVVGAGFVGEQLVCGAGSWNGTVAEFRYEWLRDALPTASGLTYDVTTADEGHTLWCVVTAIGTEGSAEAESANSVAIPRGRAESLPENIIPPELSGQAAVGQSLTCSTGTWIGTPAPGFTYQWVRDAGTDETIVESANANSYKVASADEGHSLSCLVTATNSAGSASELSRNSVRIPGNKPQNTVAPEVLGLQPAMVGESLTCAPGTWSGQPPPTLSYHWVRDRRLPGETIVGSNAATYTVETADEAHSLSCKVIATNSAGSSEAPSSNSINVDGSAPQNITAPRVTGTPAAGNPLTCERGTWSGVPTPTYSYLWVRDRGMPGEEAIGGASSATYVIPSEDRGHSLSCDVTATNSEGSSSQSSERIVVPAGTGGTSPHNVVPPTVSGNALLGATLTCAEGTWAGSPAPALTYQWLRDGTDIPSATASTYVVVEADQGHSLSCEVTAINGEGVASKASADIIEIPGVAPENTEPPQVSGTPAVGESLACLRGGWSGSPPPTFEYQWLRNGASIPSATASSYTVATADRGESLSCRITARNSAGTAEATSNNSLEIPGNQPQNTVAPEVLGSPAVGELLTCSHGTWSGQPPPTYAYQWLLAGVDIPGATTNTYTVALADRGLSLSCEVTASNHEGTRSAASQSIHVPGIRPTNIEPPQVSGIAAVGQQLTCVRGIWNGQPPPTFSYKWVRDGTIIVSATGSAYTIALGDEGHLLSCVVTATNSEGTTEVESGNAVAIPNQAAHVETRPVVSFPPTARSAALHAPPTTAQILADLRTQLTRAARGARLSSLRKRWLYAFSFAAPTAGKLELAWYEAPTRSSHGTSSKPVLLASSSVSFTRAGTKTVTLRLTSTGRRLVTTGNRIALTLKSAFVQPRKRPITWLDAFVISY